MSSACLIALFQVLPGVESTAVGGGGVGGGEECGFLRSSASRASSSASERSARWRLSSHRAKASPLQTTVSPKADGPSDKLEGKKKEERKQGCRGQ